MVMSRCGLHSTWSGQLCRVKLKDYNLHNHLPLYKVKLWYQQGRSLGGRWVGRVHHMHLVDAMLVGRRISKQLCLLLYAVCVFNTVGPVGPVLVLIAFALFWTLV